MTNLRSAVKEDWCVYYSGTRNDACEMGHVYLDIARPLDKEDRAYIIKYRPENPERVGIINRIPCLRRNGLDTCADRDFPTPEELEEQTRKLYEKAEEINTARAAIVEHLGGEGKHKIDISGCIACPICQGKLHFSFAGSYNGHIHAHCETKECVSWME